jgi:hypothetical protein
MRAIGLVVVLLMGCAEIKQSLKEELSGGAEPRVDIIDKGEGWVCTLASDMHWSGCWRTADECASGREKTWKEAIAAGDVAVKFGACQKALQASCLTYEKLVMQSNGSAKPEPMYECTPDDASCALYKENIGKDSSYSHVSKCISLK